MNTNDSKMSTNFRGLLLIFMLGTVCDGSELQVIQGNGAFAGKVYDILSKEKGNVVFSPISAHAALSMTYQGADGGTDIAFAKTLNVLQAKDAADGYKTLLNRLNNVANVTLSIANKVYVQEGAKLLETFKSLVANNFYSNVETLNFGKNIESAKTMNEWVENKTNKKIKDLIDPNDLSADTRLVLLNAIYFKGAWMYPFDKSDTNKDKFYINNDESVDVDMMHMIENLQYKEDISLNARILSLPYINRDLKMIIILPNERNGINDLEKKLATTDFTGITDGSSEIRVKVHLPRFKIEKTTDLQPVLEKIGLGIIFDPKRADFRKILENDEKLFVSKAIQKAFIEVNEEGAEAAAATDVQMLDMSSAPIRPDKDFKADHPFFIIITENSNPYFVGRLSNPKN